MDAAGYQSAMKAVRPAILKLLTEAHLTKDNSFTNYQTGEKYITTKWLFQQPQVHPYRKLRHGITQNLQNEPGICVIKDQKGFIVAIRSEFRIEPFTQKKANPHLSSNTRPSGFKSTSVAKTDSYAADEDVYEDVDEADSEYDYSSASSSVVFSNKNAAAKYTAKSVSSAFSTSTGSKVKSPPKNLNSASKNKTANSSKKNLDIPMGSEVQDAIYRAMIATENDVHAAFALLPEAIKRHRIKTVNELKHYINKTPKNGTMHLLKSMVPTEDNSGLVDWRNSGEHKLLFHVAAVYRALPKHLFGLPAAVSQKAYESYLWNAPRFALILGKYVHVTELLSQMPTEEQLEREIVSVLSTAFGCSMTLPKLHKSLKPTSRLRVATERSLKNFLFDCYDAFDVSDGNVVKLVGYSRSATSQAWGSRPGPAAPAASCSTSGSADGAASLADAVSQADTDSVVGAEEEEEEEDAASVRVYDDSLPEHPMDLLVVQRCTYLVLIGKWKTNPESVCSLYWLRDRLAVMPPAVDVGLKELKDTLRESKRFVFRSDGSVGIVGNKIPLLDDVTILLSLCRILYKAHVEGFTMDKCKLLDAFNAGRGDFINLSMNLLSRFLRGKTYYFRLDGHNVRLADRELEFRARLAAQGHGEGLEANERNRISLCDKAKVYDCLRNTLLSAAIECIRTDGQRLQSILLTGCTELVSKEQRQLLDALREDDVVVSTEQLDQFLQERSRTFRVDGQSVRLSDELLTRYKGKLALSLATPPFFSTSRAKPVPPPSRTAAKLSLPSNPAICVLLYEILRNAIARGIVMDKRGLLEAFNAKYESISMSFLSRLLLERAGLFRVYGHSVHLTNAVLESEALTEYARRTANISSARDLLGEDDQFELHPYNGAASLTDSGSVDAEYDDEEEEDAASESGRGDALPQHPMDLLVVQRCTYLVLIGKWRTDPESVCSVKWLRDRLAVMPPAVYVGLKRLEETLRDNPRFVFRSNGSVGVAGNKIPMLDDIEILLDLNRILYKAHVEGVTMDKCRLLDAFNARRNDFIVLSMNLLSRFLREKTHSYRLDGHNVHLVNLEFHARLAKQGHFEKLAEEERNRIALQDKARVFDSLCWTLYKAHKAGSSAMDKSQLVDALQKDGIVVSMGQLNQFLKEKWFSFRLDCGDDVVRLKDGVIACYASLKPGGDGAPPSASTSRARLAAPPPPPTPKAPSSSGPNETKIFISLCGILRNAHARRITMDKRSLLETFNSRHAETISMTFLNRLLRERNGVFRLEGHSVYLTDETLESEALVDYAMNADECVAPLPKKAESSTRDILREESSFELYQYVCRILYDAHERGVAIDKRQLLDELNRCGKRDNFVLSMGQLSGYLRKETNFFRVKGHNVYFTDSELKQYADFKAKVRGGKRPTKPAAAAASEDEEEEPAFCSYMNWQHDPSAEEEEDASSSFSSAFPPLPDAAGSLTISNDVTATGRNAELTDPDLDLDHLAPEDHDAGFAFVPPDDELVQKSILSIERFMKLMKF